MIKYLKKNYFEITMVFLIVYFILNILTGDRGLISLLKKQSILKDLINNETVLLQKIDTLELKNSLLSDKIDLDFVDIMIRDKFIFGKEGEKIYRFKDNEN